MNDITVSPAATVLSCLLLLACVQAALLPAIFAPIVIYLAAGIVPSVILLSSARAEEESAAVQGKQHTQSCSQHAAGGDGGPIVKTSGSDSAGTLQMRAHGSALVAADHAGVQDANRAAACAPSSTLAAAVITEGLPGMLCSGAASAPPCTGCCNNSTCPWHLPMALSLSQWAQNTQGLCSSSQHASISRLRRSSSCSGQSGDDPKCPPGGVFSFASTSAGGHDADMSHLAAPGLLRSLSAPAAPDSCDGGKLLKGKQRQDMPAQDATTMLSWQTTLWGDNSNNMCVGASGQPSTAGPAESEQPSTAGGRAAAVPPVFPLQVASSAAQDASEPCTPAAQVLHSELLAVLQQICLNDQLTCSTSSLQPTDGSGQSEIEQQQQQRQQVSVAPASNLPFIATSTRHSMCMRWPSMNASSSTLSRSCSGGVASGIPPLPSPADSPLARRLSQRDDSGLPTSPVLAELVSSGSRRLRSYCSLDTVRARSSPGSSSCCHSGLEQQQQQQQQAAPWSSVQLRPVMHLLQQRQQQQGHCPDHNTLQEDSSPRSNARRLERSRTCGGTLELSVSAEEANGVSGDSNGDSSSRSPMRQLFVRSCTGSSERSSADDGTPVPASGATPHRLSCCSSATNPLVEGDTAVHSPEAAQDRTGRSYYYKELLSMWSANGAAAVRS